MKYKAGDLIEDRRGSFDGEIGVIVNTFYDGELSHYKIFWINGEWAGRKSDEVATEVDNGDNCRRLEQN
tara:strand:- start:737 stop:943 length:207 start_codon:yes stop_codon:yes gene_type:complete